MKRCLPWIIALLLALVPPGPVCSDPMEALVGRFSAEYDGLAPPPNSSVHGDFKLERVMVGSAYTIGALKLIYDQNARLESKYDEMLQKYDEIMEQNREMIELLKVIARKGKE